MLVDRLEILKPKENVHNRLILIIGGAGGVGSMTIQLVRALAPDFTVIATASRDATTAFCQEHCGAHHVVDHSQPLAPQVAALGLGPPAYVFSTTHTGEHLHDIVQLMEPQGKFGLIDDPVGGLDIMPFKLKSISIHWELMFTRSMFQTPDMQEQHVLLTKVSELVQAGKLQTTLTETVSTGINAANLEQAHATIRSGKACGKIVLEGGF